MRNLLTGTFLIATALIAAPASAAEPGGPLADALLKPLRTLNDAYHPWRPADSREEWERQAEAIREQILVSNGLWPMPPKTPLDPVVHGRIDRDEYTVEKVFFASLPGHYVTGNLYRPKRIDGKAPGVLCPHGHWANGRFYDAGERKAQQEIESGAEEHMAGARYPLQARMVQLARMGCVVFHYDMVGYADSAPVEHRAGFADATAGLWLQNAMGLQTWNSIRALDFLLSLPEVDPERVGVTGASGGGTQTFMLCAIDPRPTVAFPAVMVSTAMQGGCICENADYLRLGINNIAIAALFAPKPLAMSGADDWTIDIETKGLPELRQVYSLFGKPDLVHAKCFPQFGHNYNQVSREMMYEWFNRHLDLGFESPIKEQDFEPIPPEQLSVFDEQHPRPDDAKSADALRECVTEVAREQLEELLPTSADKLAAYRRVVGTAARVMLDSGVPKPHEIEVRSEFVDSEEGLTVRGGTLGRKGAGEAIPFVLQRPANFNGRVLVWIDGGGSSRVLDEGHREIVRAILETGTAVASGDVFLTGAFLRAGREPTIPVNESYHGYTFGYNRPVLSNRVRDILTLIGYVAGQDGVTSVDLAGTGDAAPWVLLARGLAGDRVRRTVADLHGFHFGKVTETSDPMFLPGALKYGDIGGFVALAAPGELMVCGTAEVPDKALEPLTAAYRTAGGKLRMEGGPLTPEAGLEFLLR